VIKADGPYMTKGGVKIMFDIVVDTNHGQLYAIRLKRWVGQFVGQFAGRYIVKQGQEEYLKVH
jgi:hypothetical protein